jgi:hypothetical protein
LFVASCDGASDEPHISQVPTGHWPSSPRISTYTLGRDFRANDDSGIEPKCDDQFDYDNSPLSLLTQVFLGAASVHIQNDYAYE